MVNIVSGDCSPKICRDRRDDKWNMMVSTVPGNCLIEQFWKRKIASRPEEHWSFPRNKAGMLPQDQGDRRNDNYMIGFRNSIYDDPDG